MATEKLREIDLALWLLALGVGIALVLIASKLSADNTGRVITVLLLLAMSALVWLAVWKIRWFHVRKLRLWIGLITVASSSAALGCWVWPYTLAISPRRVGFSLFVPGVVNSETFTFRVLNRSDEDVYVAEFDFIIDDLSASVRDFEIGIPKASRKPYGEGGPGAEHFADTRGILCRDPSQRPLYILSILRLTPTKQEK
jgi:hypothetical protein